MRCFRLKIWIEDGHFYYHNEKNVFKDDSNKTIVEKVDGLFSELIKVHDFNVGDILIDKEMIKVFQKFEKHLFRRYHNGQITIMQNCTFTGTKDDFVDFVCLFQEVQLWNFDVDNSIICDEVIKTLLKRHRFDFFLKHVKISRLPEITDATLTILKDNLGFPGFVIGDGYVTNITIEGVERFIRDLLPTCVADSLTKDRPIQVQISLGTIEVNFEEAATMINGLKKEFDLKLRSNTLEEKYRFAVNGNKMTIEFFTKEHLTHQKELIGVLDQQL